MRAGRRSRLRPRGAERNAWSASPVDFPLPFRGCGQEAGEADHERFCIPRRAARPPSGPRPALDRMPELRSPRPWGGGDDASSPCDRFNHRTPSGRDTGTLGYAAGSDTRGERDRSGWPGGAVGLVPSSPMRQAVQRLPEALLRTRRRRKSGVRARVRYHIPRLFEIVWLGSELTHARRMSSES